MNPNKFMLSAIFVMIMLIGYAGGEKKKTPNTITVLSPSQLTNAGVTSFTLNQSLGLFAGAEKIDGTKTYKDFTFQGMLEVNHYVIDNLLVGAGINFYGEKYTNITLNPEGIERYSGIGGHVNVGYGFRPADAVTIIPKLSVGYGGETEKYSGYYGDSKDKIKNVWMNLTANVPLYVARNVAVTPYAGFSYCHSSDGFVENTNSFIGGFNMEIYMGCGDKICDFGDDEYDRSLRYQPGSFLFGSRLGGQIKLGGQTQTYEDEAGEKYKQGINNSGLNGTVLYYPIQNLGVGANIDFSFSRINSNSNNYKAISNDLTFAPTARYNIPASNHWNDVFVEGSFMVGYSNFKYIYDGDATKDNASVVGYEACVGYNYFISPVFSLNLMAGFTGETYKFKQDDSKENYAGFVAALGWNVYINRQ